MWGHKCYFIDFFWGEQVVVGEALPFNISHWIAALRADFQHKIQEFAYAVCPINVEVLNMEETPTSIVFLILFLEYPSWTSNKVLPPAVMKAYSMIITLFPSNSASFSL